MNTPYTQYWPHAIPLGGRFRRAALSGSDLRRATGGGWTEEQLRAAFSLDGATMPDGQEYKDWIKDKEGRKEDGEGG